MPNLTAIKHIFIHFTHFQFAGSTQQLNTYCFVFNIVLIHFLSSKHDI